MGNILIFKGKARVIQGLMTLVLVRPSGVPLAWSSAYPSGASEDLRMNQS